MSKTKLRKYGFSLTLLVLLTGSFFIISSCGGGGSDKSSTSTSQWVTVDSVSINLTSAIISGTAWVSDKYAALNCVGIECFFDQRTDDYPGVDVSYNNLTTGATGTATSKYGGGTMWVHQWQAKVPIELGKNTVQILAYDPSGAGGSISVEVLRQPLVTITVTPINPSIATGIMKQFIAYGIFSDNSTKDLTNEVKWMSSDTTKATIDNRGLATGVDVGSATITASAENISGSTTLDITTWISRTSHTTTTLYNVVWSGTQFVAVGGSGTILTSPDGVTWTSQNSNIANDLFGVTWSGTQFVAVGGSGTILTSPDGVTWTSQNSNTAKNDLFDVTWAGTQFVAVGGSGNIVTSPDGVTWTPRTSNTSNTLYSIAQLVAVGSSGTILTSPDGITWTPQSSGTGYDLHDIIWFETQFVAVGSSGTILTSPYGTTWTWTSQTSGISGDVYDVVWYWTEFVTVGGSGTILSSPDGVTWTSHSSGTNNTLRSVAHSWSQTWSQIVAVGDGGTILTSQ
jgi:photosystem II stability/assembly factor-like uncharacterized protein